MSFPKYPAYKDSGMEWLGEVPAHWRLQRFDARSQTHRETVEPAALSGQDVLHYSIPTILETGHAAIEAGASIDSNKLVVRFDQLLVSKLNPHKQVVVLASPHVQLLTVASTEFVPLIPSGANSRYIQYVWQSSVCLHYLLARCESATRSHQRVAPCDITKLMWAWPDDSEQSSITCFLDHETARIDALIEEQKHLIELLREKRQAVISQAVTKGLNPSVPMKDSGVEWLGKVPAHWDFGPLKRFWSITDCKHITAEFVDEGIPLASIREVQGWTVLLNGAKTTTKFFFDQLVEGNRSPLPGDIIFSRNATVGEAALVPEDSPIFAMGQDVCLLRRIESDFSPAYMLRQIKSAVISTQLEVAMIGSTFKRINVERIRELMVCMPPALEQVKIADALAGGVQLLDDLLNESSAATLLLQERRSALISAAVTGKIDVRHYQAEAA